MADRNIVLTEFSEGSTHNSYFATPEEAKAEMERRIDLPRTSYGVSYEIWQILPGSYDRPLLAEGFRPAYPAPCHHNLTIPGEDEHGWYTACATCGQRGRQHHHPAQVLSFGPPEERIEDRCERCRILAEDLDLI